MVAELGTFTARDTQLGHVRVHRAQAGQKGLESILPTRGRIADVRLKDVDGDGRLDIPSPNWLAQNRWCPYRLE